MGIKDLWQILAPFCDRRPLFQLQGKKVAIDLSGWVCEAQCVTEYTVQPRMYLRTLYFRTCYLLMMDVAPIFVLEGKAPEMKYGTIAARNAIQFKGAKPRNEAKGEEKNVGKDRSRFNHTLRQCEEMLGYMGLACIAGNGEAEALCAYLNDDQLVDGIISQDSDCFAYGAKTVFRNFSISQQGVHAAKGGSVDVYDITKAYESLNFGRNKIIALALLCGCDYSEGVRGIGKDSALKLFERVGEDTILERLRTWKKDSKLYDELEKQMSDKSVCTSCGHFGRIQAHTKSGCVECKTSKGCDSSKFKEDRQSIRNELNIRSKALQYPNFPDEELISEFLERKDNVSKLNLRWRRPDLSKFVKFTVKFLTWEEIYAFEKFLPILARWQVLFHASIPKNENGIVFPDRIKKVRNPKGVPSYEIIWKDSSNFFINLIPSSQLSGKDLEKLWSTIEPQSLVENAYPDLVRAFKDSKKPKTKRKMTKHIKATQEINDMLQNVSISEPKMKKTRKAKTANKTKAIVNTLDKFLKKCDNDEPKYSQQISSTPIKKGNFSFDLDLTSFGDEDDNADLSEVVENIVRKNIILPGYVMKEIEQIAKSEERMGNVKDQSCFFDLPEGGGDLFEQTFNAEYCVNTARYEDDEEDIKEIGQYVISDGVQTCDKYKSDGDNEQNSAKESHKDYAINSDNSETIGNEKQNDDNDTDSFTIGTYVPLYERLQRKRKS